MKDWVRRVVRLRKPGRAYMARHSGEKPIHPREVRREFLDFPSLHSAIKQQTPIAGVDARRLRGKEVFDHAWIEKIEGKAPIGTLHMKPF